MVNKKITMIRLEDTTKKQLDKMKIIPRESYNDALLRLIKDYLSRTDHKKDGI